MTDTLPPYPRTKESGVPWLGEIPAHWELPRLGSVLHERGETNDKGDVDQVLSVLRDIGVIRYEDKGNIGNKKSEDTRRYKVVHINDIVVNSMNVIIGSVGLSRYKGCLSPVYYVLTPRSKDTDPNYLNCVFKMKPFQQSLVRLGNGILAHRMRIPMEKLKAEPIPLPPPDEQIAIARYLDYVDLRVRRYIKAKRRLIEVLTEQKQAIIHQAVTRGLDPDVPMKESGVAWLGEVPAHWEVVRLKNVAEVQTGLTLGKNYQNVATAFYPYLRVANVQHGRLDLSVVKDIAVPPSEAARTLLKSGDVLMTEGGDIDKLGRGCVWRGEIENCLHQNHVFAVRCNTDRLSPDFLVGLMVSGHGRGYFQLTAKQTTNLASTNSTTLRAFPVLLPPRIEQQAILSHVDDHTARLEEAINRTLREIDLIREYRTRLIADVVTGKVDVRGMAASLGEEAGFDMSSADQDEAWDEEEALDGDDGEEMDEEVEA